MANVRPDDSHLVDQLRRQGRWVVIYRFPYYDPDHEYRQVERVTLIGDFTTDVAAEAVTDRLNRCFGVPYYEFHALAPYHVMGLPYPGGSNGQE